MKRIIIFLLFVFLSLSVFIVFNLIGDFRYKSIYKKSYYLDKEIVLSPNYLSQDFFSLIDKSLPPATSGRSYFQVIKRYLPFLDKKENLFPIISQQVSNTVNMYITGTNMPLNYFLSFFKNYKSLAYKNIGFLNSRQDQKKLDLINFKKYLIYHQQLIEEIVYKSNMNEDEKKTLYQKEKQLFNDLNKKIDSLVPGFNADKIIYSLNSVSPGIYNLSFKTLPPSPAPTLEIDNKKYRWDNLGFFKDVTILSSNSFLSLNYKLPAVVFSNLKWSNQYDATWTYPFTYSYKLPSDLKEKKYFIGVNYNFPERVVLSLERILKSKEGANYEPILIEPMLVGEKKTYENVFLNEPDIYDYRILLASQKSIDKNLSKINFVLKPVIEPEIILENIASVPSNKNSLLKPALIFFKSLIPVLLFLLILFLLRNFLVLALRFVILVLKKIRWLLLVVFLSTAVVTIFHFAQPPAALVRLIIAFWICLIIGFKLEERISFLIFISCFIISSSFLMVQNEVQAEKFAIMAFCFLVIGSFQSLLIFLNRPQG